MTDVEQTIAEELEPDEDGTAADDDSEDSGDGADEEETGTAAAEPAPRSQKEIEELQAKLEREAERHSKRVAEIMGDDFALLVPNPTDWTPGFLFNVPEMLPFPEQVAAFDAIIGRASEDDLLDAEDAEACDKCNARGRTKTGSKVEGQVTKPCGKCNGTGWTTKFPPLAQVAPMAGAQPMAPGAPITPDTYQVKDSWGRPMGHPHFGLEPASITA